MTAATVSMATNKYGISTISKAFESMAWEPASYCTSKTGARNVWIYGCGQSAFVAAVAVNVASVFVPAGCVVLITAMLLLLLLVVFLSLLLVVFLSLLLVLFRS